jgi:hypothetical protein
MDAVGFANSAEILSAMMQQRTKSRVSSKKHEHHRGSFSLELIHSKRDQGAE